MSKEPLYDQRQALHELAMVCMSATWNLQRSTPGERGKDLYVNLAGAVEDGFDTLPDASLDRGADHLLEVLRVVKKVLQRKQREAEARHKRGWEQFMASGESAKVGGKSPAQVRERTE